MERRYSKLLRLSDDNEIFWTNDTRPKDATQSYRDDLLFIRKNGSAIQNLYHPNLVNEFIRHSLLGEDDDKITPEHFKLAIQYIWTIDKLTVEAIKTLHSNLYEYAVINESKKEILETLIELVYEEQDITIRENKDVLIKLTVLAAWFVWEFYALNPFDKGNTIIGRLIFAYLLKPVTKSPIWLHSPDHIFTHDINYLVPSPFVRYCISCVKKYCADIHSFL
jgi:hypothetical protein